MPFNENLVSRIRAYFKGREDVRERKMFGGIAFMVGGHMCVGVAGDDLMARVGPEKYQQSLNKKHVRHMDFTGKPLTGFVFVSPDGIKSRPMLERWIALCESFVFSLPPK